jgi:hypothetical protein
LYDEKKKAREGPQQKQYWGDSCPLPNGIKPAALMNTLEILKKEEQQRGQQHSAAQCHEDPDPSLPQSNPEQRVVGPNHEARDGDNDTWEP